MTSIRLVHLVKRFGAATAVDDFSLAIADGELFFLLGPSGCGKTTLLRMVAGFVAPDAGEIWFGARRVNAVPPRDRDTGMVFQNYALWPHLTVAQNVGYGLDVRRIRGAERQERIHQALAMVRMTELAHRRPTQLSGGQQQRVALARALVVQPRIVLLDEPLSNLDARLRVQMRDEIRRIHDATGLTMVYVTHDQKEALALADRMAVMDRGRIVQVGTPTEVYSRPVSEFVARFMGETNIVDGVVRSIDAAGLVTVETALGSLVGRSPRGPIEPRTPVVCSIRPEAISLTMPGPADGINRIGATVERGVFLGEVSHVYVKAPCAQDLVVYVLQGQDGGLAPGRQLGLTVPPDQVVVIRRDERDGESRPAGGSGG